MATTILDDLFDEAALTEITAHTPNIGGAYTVRNISGGGTPTLRIAAGAGYAYAHAGSAGITNAAALSSTDWDATAEFDRVSSGAFPGFRLGCQMTEAGAGYVAVISHYGNLIRLYKATGWSATGSHVAEWTGGLPSGAETLLLQKRGAVIKVFLNGSERISYTDPSALTAGTLTLFGWDGAGPSDGRIHRITTTSETGGTDGTATGVTITAAGSFIPGSASGQAGATASGVTITAAGSFIPGSASGVINGTLNFQAAGMEFGSRSGLGIDTFGLDAGESYRYTIHADGLTLGSALHTSSAVTLDSAGKLANYVGSAVAPGSTYRIVAIRQADGEAATFRMVAS